MTYFIRVLVYFVSFAISLYALSALDFNRLLKKNRVMAAQALYIVLAMAMAYLLGEFLIGIMYGFRDIQALV